MAHTTTLAMMNAKEQRMIEQRIAHRPPGITVFINTFHDGTIELDGIRPSATVDDLKAEILYREGLPTQLQMLVYRGKTLEDGGRTLRSYGVDDALGKFEYTFDLHLRTEC